MISIQLCAKGIPVPKPNCRINDKSDTIIKKAATLITSIWVSRFLNHFSIKLHVRSPPTIAKFTVEVSGLARDGKTLSKIDRNRTKRKKPEMVVITPLEKDVSFFTTLKRFLKNLNTLGRNIPTPIEANVQATMPYLNIELFLMPSPKPKYSLITKISSVAVTKKKKETRR
jgi:hypothetical protein